MPFEETTAIVTGGASGIGLAITEALTSLGTKVAIFDIQEAALDEQVARLRGEGRNVKGYVTDITDRDAVETAVGVVRVDLGPVLILVNNAGAAKFRRFADITPEEWARTIDVNLHGTFHVTQVVVPDMVAARWGRIVNISSSSTHSGQPYMAPYVAAKSGVNGLTKSLALEYGEFGITVNAIPPGFVDTPMLRRDAEKGRLGPGGIDEAISRTPVRRVGRPEDIANACVFLCRDETSYVTGQILGVNGGRNT